jgi:hypothetical protein
MSYSGREGPRRGGSSRNGPMRTKRAFPWPSRGTCWELHVLRCLEGVTKLEYKLAVAGSAALLGPGGGKLVRLGTLLPGPPVAS